MVISFLVLWSICLSSSLVYFKNGPEYLTRNTAQVFIPLIRSQFHSFVSSNFLVHLRYSFLIFSFISSCFMLSAFNIPKYLYISFSIFFLDFVVPFRLSGVVLSLACFLCQIPSLCSDCIFPPRVLEFPVLFHFLLTVWFHVQKVINLFPII